MNRFDTIGIRLSCSLIMLCVAYLLTGCIRQNTVIPVDEDEAYLRQEFCIPEDILMVSLWRSADVSGWYGREGLRIVGEFQQNDPQVDHFTQAMNDCEWEPLPLPEIVNLFSEPPSELPEGVDEGLYFCTVTYYGQWVDEEWQANGVMDDPVILPCRDYEQMSKTYGEMFDHYRVGILDMANGKIIVVLKNYY